MPVEATVPLLYCLDPSMPMPRICVAQLAPQLERDLALSLRVAASSNKLIFVICESDRRVGQCLADCILSLAIVRSFLGLLVI